MLRIQQRINRIRLEFKAGRPSGRCRGHLGINRIRLEFKELRSLSMKLLLIVLIESDWNLK